MSANKNPPALNDQVGLRAAHAFLVQLRALRVTQRKHNTHGSSVRCRTTSEIQTKSTADWIQTVNSQRPQPQQTDEAARASKEATCLELEHERGHDLVREGLDELLVLFVDTTTHRSWMSTINTSEHVHGKPHPAPVAANATRHREIGSHAKAPATGNEAANTIVPAPWLRDP